jgi:hypothetical protein
LQPTGLFWHCCKNNLASMLPISAIGGLDIYVAFGIDQMMMFGNRN